MSKILAVYKTTDGEVFSTLTEAEEHQSDLDIWNKIMETFGVYGEVKLTYFEDFLAVVKFYEESKK